MINGLRDEGGKEITKSEREGEVRVVERGRQSERERVFLVPNEEIRN